MFQPPWGTFQKNGRPWGVVNTLCVCLGRVHCFFSGGDEEEASEYGGGSVGSGYGGGFPACSLGTVVGGGHMGSAEVTMLDSSFQKRLDIRSGSSLQSTAPMTLELKYLGSGGRLSQASGSRAYVLRISRVGCNKEMGDGGWIPGPGKGAAPYKRPRSTVILTSSAQPRSHSYGTTCLDEWGVSFDCSAVDHSLYDHYRSLVCLQRS